MKEITQHIKQALLQWQIGPDQVIKFQTQQPPPYFDSEDEAWSELHHIIDWIYTLNGHQNTTAKYQFVRCNFSELFLRECVSYRLLYDMSLRIKLDLETAPKIPNYRNILSNASKSNVLALVA